MMIELPEVIEALVMEAISTSIHDPLLVEVSFENGQAADPAEKGLIMDSNIAEELTATILRQGKDPEELTGLNHTFREHFI